jgi:hypothetical protein
MDSVFGSSVGARDVDLRREVFFSYVTYSRRLLTVAYRLRRSSVFVDYFGSTKEDKSNTLHDYTVSLRRTAYNTFSYEIHLTPCNLRHQSGLLQR